MDSPTSQRSNIQACGSAIRYRPPRKPSWRTSLFDALGWEPQAGDRMAQRYQKQLLVFQACAPAERNATRFYEYIFVRIGYSYDAPNATRTGVFESCDGDNQGFPGIYAQNSVTVTYQQPPEGFDAITFMLHTARVPANSLNCASFASSEMYALVRPFRAPAGPRLLQPG